ncbi:hypothetical protein [Streptomyces sp. NPDC089919]|uniref:hypothetical protein n=1 Tax=Streptomyces sp. NPDC089919 TaxID=3155188 RepID=UPI00342167E7
MINGIAYVGIRGIQPQATNFDWHNLTNPARNPGYPTGVACGIAVDEHSNGANIEIATTTGQVWETFCTIDNPTPSLGCGTTGAGNTHPWVQVLPGPTSAPALRSAPALTTSPGTLHRQTPAPAVRNQAVKADKFRRQPVKKNQQADQKM